MRLDRRSFIQWTAVTSTALVGPRALALPFLYKTVDYEVCTEGAQHDPTTQILSNLRRLSAIHHGFPVNQLEHALQAATRARKLGLSGEMVVASLCHDMAKTISSFNHEAMAAEMLRPYVSHPVYQMMKYHGIFQGRFFWRHLGREENLYERYRGAPWFQLALDFTSEIDAPAFDKNCKPDPLESFENDIVRLVRSKVG